MSLAPADSPAAVAGWLAERLHKIEIAVPVLSNRRRRRHLALPDCRATDLITGMIFNPSSQPHIFTRSATWTYN